MPLVEVRDFNSLIYNITFLDQSVKKQNKKQMKNLSKCQKAIIKQQGTDLVFCTTKTIIN